MKKLIATAAASIALVLVLAGSSAAWLNPTTTTAARIAAVRAAAAKHPPVYVDEMTLSNVFEAHYQLPNRAHVQTAFCSGQRWRGVKTSEFGLDRYTYFSCDLDATDEHIYTAIVHTVAYDTHGYWSYLVMNLKMTL